MKQPNYRRRFVWTAAAMVAVLPLLAWAAVRTTQTIHNSPPEWVPEQFEQRHDYIEFIQQFEGNDSIIISWDGCTVDDPRLAAFGEALRNPDDARHRRQHEKLFVRILTGYDAVRSMTDEPLDLSREEVLRRLEGSLIGPDGETSCAVVVPTVYASHHREETIGRLLDVAEESIGLSREDVYLAGPPVDGYIIDRESIRSLSYYSTPSALVALLLCWVCLRSLRFTVAVVFVAVFEQVAVLALIYALGYRMNAVLIVTPALVFVLTVSAGVHLVNYYYDQLRLGYREDAPRRAMLAGWIPCTLAAVTTAIGVASLSVSQIEPIRAFSIVAVVGILSSVGLLFLILPGVMQGYRPPSQRKAVRPAAGTLRSFRDIPWQDRLAALVRRRHTAIAVVCLVVMAAAAWGLQRVRTSVNIRGLFVSESRIVRDYHWLHEILGPLVSLEVVLRFEDDHPLDLLERLELVKEVQQELKEMEVVGGVMSAATFAPPIPRHKGRLSIRDIAERTRYRNGLENSLGALEERNYLHQSEATQSWRISARVPALEEFDYGHVLRRVEERVGPLLAQREEETQSGIRATYTGVMPLVDEAQRALLHDLFASFLTAFGAVAVVMMLVLRSVRAGLLAMLPNAFPTAILFGMMGWLDLPADIGSIMTASVALGIAVDGTLHFLNWFRRERSDGQSPQVAVARSYQHCGKALVQATFICGLGLLVYALSDFVPTRQFAWMMLLLLAAALMGDLLLLPSLLVGRLGRSFLRRSDPAPAALNSAGIPPQKAEASAE